ncbi:MAG: YitT family protein [Clostridia bacterium]|nr:YitT family protein [Clostridia bacterium]
MSEQLKNDIGENMKELPPKITHEDIAKGNSSKSKVIFSHFQTLLALLLSSFLVSFSAYSLIAPNNFTIGGISGLAIILNVASKNAIPQSIIVFSANLPLIILSFFLVRKRFALLSGANILLQSLWLLILEAFLPDFKIIFENNGEKIFAALASGLCVGVAIAFAFKSGGSTGGADILAVLIQKKVGASSIARMMLIINCIIIASSLFVFPGDTLAQRLLPIMMSAFEAYIESKTNESMLNGFHSAIEFRIITSKPEEISLALMKTIQRGVTSLPATGMYTGEKRSMLVCVVQRRQITTVKRLVHSIDPHSFATVSTVSQVMGLGFIPDDVNN